MKHVTAFVVVIAAGLIALSAAVAQEKSDTTIVFEAANPNLFQSTSSYQPKRNAWGIDLMVSNNGFAGGGFYRKEQSDEIAWFVSLAISDVKDESEVEYYDYFGQSFVPGKKNRLLLIPLMGGVQYRLFRDDIVDNFRPYVMAGLGPTMIYVSPYSTVNQIRGSDGAVFTYTEQIDFFESLGKGRAHYSIGGFVGFGAYFGIDKSTLSGISLRYYYIPFGQGVEVVERKKTKEFGGLYITMNFGSIF